MTRIIAGAVGGRRIEVPRRGTRPTSDRVRESIFSSLTAERGWSGLRVLDLFAGSGALGLEALSRGAATAVFVESDSRAAAVCRRNVEALGFSAQPVPPQAPASSPATSPQPAAGSRAVVVQADVATWLGRDRLDRPPFDLVFADPPYSVGDAVIGRLLITMVGRGWLAEAAEVVLERPATTGAPLWPPGFEPGVGRAFGGTVIHRAIWYGPEIT